jgi:DNA-directed RNA polymerase subunit F
MAKPYSIYFLKLSYDKESAQILGEELENELFKRGIFPCKKTVLENLSKVELISEDHLTNFIANALVKNSLARQKIVSLFPLSNDEIRYLFYINSNRLQNYLLNSEDSYKAILQKAIEATKIKEIDPKWDFTIFVISSIAKIRGYNDILQEIINIAKQNEIKYSIKGVSIINKIYPEMKYEVKDLVDRFNAFMLPNSINPIRYDINWNAVDEIWRQIIEISTNPNIKILRSENTALLVRFGRCFSDCIYLSDFAFSNDSPGRDMARLIAEIMLYAKQNNLSVYVSNHSYLFYLKNLLTNEEYGKVYDYRGNLIGHGVKIL